MSKEVLDVVERSIALLVMVAGGTTVFVKMFEWLKARDKEKSVGISKVIELMEKDKKFEASISALEHSDERQDERIMELKAEHKEIMQLVLQYFKK